MKDGTKMLITRTNDRRYVRFIRQLFVKGDAKHFERVVDIDGREANFDVSSTWNFFCNVLKHKVSSFQSWRCLFELFFVEAIILRLF